MTACPAQGRAVIAGSVSFFVGNGRILFFQKKTP
jgi:hypothetical protein